MMGKTRAVTDPGGADERLRGRTYAIPFEQVWKACLHLAGGGLNRWHVLDADDQRGFITAEARSAIFRVVDDVYIRIGLDENGQTRVDMELHTRNDKGDMGRLTRMAGAFARRLDRYLKAEPWQILEASSPSTVRANR
ncbi:MAG: DUF1499 domain-containing protein [Gemmatimonadota bacterium]|nr:DUF1499 domain-containing protein [Gemmatimonadota bacterium]